MFKQEQVESGSTMEMFESLFPASFNIYIHEIQYIIKNSTQRDKKEGDKVFTV